MANLSKLVANLRVTNDYFPLALRHVKYISRSFDAIFYLLNCMACGHFQLFFKVWKSLRRLGAQWLLAGNMPAWGTQHPHKCTLRSIGLVFIFFKLCLQQQDKANCKISLMRTYVVTRIAQQINSSGPVAWFARNSINTLKADEYLIQTIRKGRATLPLETDSSHQHAL